MNYYHGCGHWRDIVPLDSVAYAPFSTFENGMHSILGAMQQFGCYGWMVDTKPHEALKFLIGAGIITFKGSRGKLAEYIPLVTKFNYYNLSPMRWGR